VQRERCSQDEDRAFLARLRLALRPLVDVATNDQLTSPIFNYSEYDNREPHAIVSIVNCHSRSCPVRNAACILDECPRKVANHKLHPAAQACSPDFCLWLNKALKRPTMAAVYISIYHYRREKCALKSFDQTTPKCLRQILSFGFACLASFMFRTGARHRPPRSM
jgi:hypothetical protein